MRSNDVRQQSEISDADRVPTRIAFRIGINANEAEVADLDAHLFLDFAPACCLYRLADIDKSAGERVGAFEWLVHAPDEKHPARIVEDHAIGGERGRLRHSQGEPPSLCREGYRALTSALALGYRRYCPATRFLERHGKQISEEVKS